MAAKGAMPMRAGPKPLKSALEPSVRVTVRNALRIPAQ